MEGKSICFRLVRLPTGKEIKDNKALSEDEEDDLYTESIGKKEKKKNKTPIKENTQRKILIRRSKKA